MFTPAIEPPALYQQVQGASEQSIQMQKAYKDFQAKYPAYASTVSLDALREKDYKRLSCLKQVYLDYTGSSLYAESQVQSHMATLLTTVCGNPHSDSPASGMSTHMVEKARADVLAYFNASPEEYTIIFTPNATGALKLLGESYPFAQGGNFLLTFDNHNSVNGIREFARAKGASVTYIPVAQSNLRLNQDVLDTYLVDRRNSKASLFAYPAQSNFSGVQHPLEWIARAQERGWDVLLDAAAFVPTNQLDLSQWHPDFVDISFYKMFGYPTGVGCLIAKHAALAKLKKPWFAGGTVEVVSIQGNGYYFHDGFSAFEEGTINFLSFPAISVGLKHIEEVTIKKIHERVSILTDWLIKELLALHHANGTPLIRLYGPSKVRMRGGIIAMNFQDSARHVIDLNLIERYAAQANISVRTGCFCNPGSVEIINGITKEDVEKYFNGEQTLSFEDYVTAMQGYAIGALRVSLGIVSNFADVYQFVQFARTFVDKAISAAERSRSCSKHVCNSSC